MLHSISLLFTYLIYSNEWGRYKLDTTEQLHFQFSLSTFMPCRRKWQPIPVFLSGESQGRGSLVGCRLWGRTESDTAEATQQQQQWIRAADWSLPCPLSPLVTRSLHLVSVSLFMYIHLFYFLDSTYKWYYIVFVFLWLILLSIIFYRSIDIDANGSISFSFMAE